MPDPTPSWTEDWTSPPNGVMSVGKITWEAANA